MDNYRIYLLWVIVFLILFIGIYNNFHLKKISAIDFSHKNSIAFKFILPYKNNLWIVSDSGKIVDIVEDYKILKSLPIIVVPEEFVDSYFGKIKQDFLKKIPENIPSFVYEINFNENYMVLNNNAKIYFNENFDFQMYFEKLKIVYNYIEPLGIYYISDEMLVKAR
ncbi:MAG: hypothetical protein PWQ83_845 [Thermosipho sp. (in: thermotogales)]|jgi:hypothetical protein|nr:hypothetical protein [Thermosipho sp. (in: thermotogales)]